jgi:hypothetical protein
MRSHFKRLVLGVFLMGISSIAANAATTAFGPSAYLQHGDTPAEFICENCPLHVEDFEDGMLSDFLTIDNGMVFPPNGTTGTNQPSTDSVDGDDGSVDGFGLNAYSWFSGSVQSLTIDFAEGVKSAGLVFTDGDSASTNVMLEAFDMSGTSLGVINAGDLADDSFYGETAEDRFLGFTNTDGAIYSMTLSIDAGTGIEVDHIQWQSHAECVPEPATGILVLFGLLGLSSFRRNR